MSKEELENLETLSEKFIEGFSNAQSLFSVHMDFPFGFAVCLRGIAESGNRDLFQRVVDSYVSYSEKVNQGNMNQEQIKLEALDFIEFQCKVGDTGRMTIGTPGAYKTDGPARTMFLDMYSGQLAMDKGYAVTNSIKI